MTEPARPRVTGSWAQPSAGYALLVHGGAGRRPATERGPSERGCAEAAKRATEVLARGGSALEAVQLAVELLEDDPVFNAGTGGALTEDGTLELDAAIMEGTALRAGAVCSLPPFRHPIAIARAVLDEGRHVLYSGSGAVELAQRAGFVPADPQTMITEAARQQLHAWRIAKTAASGGGTVGAVARDRDGHLAAATSTGGIMGKRRGRVGDSPVLGAGTYADDTRGAASATGVGEGILRISLCAQIVTSISSGLDSETSARAAINALGERVGGDGGVIVISPSGLLAWARSTESMAWAASWDGGAASGC